MMSVQLTAEALRHNEIRWYNFIQGKNREKGVESAQWFHKLVGVRINNHHLALAEKQAARAMAGGS